MSEPFVRDDVDIDEHRPPHRMMNASADVRPTLPVDLDEKVERPRSLSRDAWDDLRHNPVFWVSVSVLVVLIVIAIAPGLFTDKSPNVTDLSKSRQGPSAEAWFGYDLQGRDIYARTIYGARASIAVGVLTALFVLVLGTTVGVAAGFFGGWIDSLLSRVTDVFFGIPLLLGGILVLASFPSGPGTPASVTIGKVVFALAVLGWPPFARIVRSSVIQIKQADYVNAARALGASNVRLVARHILPNSLVSAIVVATISLGAYIAAEATLSFLGIGLQPPVVSWGIAIADAQNLIRQSPHMLLFPAAFLSVTVLAFIMLGDAVRDAFDPKLR